MEKQQTIDKLGEIRKICSKLFIRLGGGRHSLFSAGTSPDTMPHIVGRIDPTHSMVAEVVIESLIKKLKNMGLNEQIESQMLSAQSLLKKLNATKKGYSIVSVCREYFLF